MRINGVKPQFGAPTHAVNTSGAKAGGVPQFGATQLPSLPKPYFGNVRQIRFSRSIDWHNYQHDGHFSLVNQFVQLGTQPHTADKMAIQVSKHFVPEGEDTVISYGQLLQDIRRVATGLGQAGIGTGDRVAMADMNTPEFMANYLGALSVGATMVLPNLLALQDEATKAELLMYKLEKSGAKAFMVGKDKDFEAMARLGDIQKAQKLRAVLGCVIERYGKGRWISLMQGVLDKKINLAAELEKKAAERAAKGQAFGPEEQAAFIAQKRRDFATIYSRLPKGIKIVTPADQARFRQLKPLDMEKMHRQPDKDHEAGIIFTSGTSSNPKGVVHTHGNMVYTSQSMLEKTREILNDGTQHVTLMALPLFHIFGQALAFGFMTKPMPMVFIPSLKRLVDKPDASGRSGMDKLVDTIHDYKVTIFPTVPGFIDTLAKHLKKHPEQIDKVKSLRFFVSGGAALLPETAQLVSEVMPWVKVLEGYGSTEGGINMVNLEGSYGPLGTVFPGTKLEVNDEDGGLIVRSPGVAKGYLAGTAGAEDMAAFDGKGGYRTGDIVEVDENGLGYFRGRAGLDFIKINGERRSFGTFEELIKREMGVADVMAVPFRPQGSSDDVAVTFVLNTSGHPITEADVLGRLGDLRSKEMIPSWQIPKNVVVLNRATWPEGFINVVMNKRQRKVAKDFMEKAIAAGVLKLSHTQDAKGQFTGTTQITGDLDAFAQNYVFVGKVKK